MLIGSVWAAAVPIDDCPYMDMYDQCSMVDPTPTSPVGLVAVALALAAAVLIITFLTTVVRVIRHPPPRQSGPAPVSRTIYSEDDQLPPNLPTDAHRPM